MSNKERMQHEPFRKPLTDPIELFNEAAGNFGVDQIPIIKQEPWHSMSVYLCSLNDAEIQCLKKMTEISVRRQKDRLSNNILLKVTAPLGAAWAVLTGSRELVKGSEVLLKIRDLLSATWMQPFLDQLLTYFIFGCVAIVLAYVFFWGPGLQRARRLDDAVFVALRERVLTSSGTSKEANQKTSIHDDGADG